MALLDAMANPDVRGAVFGLARHLRPLGSVKESLLL